MNPKRTGVLFIVLAAILWSSGGIGIKAVTEGPLAVAFYRSLFAAVTLLLLFRREVLSFRFSISFVAAVVSYAACLLTFVTATKWTTAANAIFLQYAGVVWVLLLSPIVLKEPMRRRDVIAVSAAFAGMALFFVGRFEPRGMAGNAMALLSSVFFATLILALRREPHASRAAVTWGNLLLAITLAPFVLSEGLPDERPLFVLALLGIFQIGFAYAAFVKGLQYVTATEASLIGMIEPVANPVWVLIFLGEQPSAFAIGGAVIVLIAVAWHTLQGEPAAEMPPPD